MGIADKFGNFNIKKVDRISQEDLKWLQHREELYKRAIIVYKAVYDVFKNENERYSQEDIENFRYSNMFVGDFGVPKHINNLQDEYISGIFSYFSNKYNVELDNNFEKFTIQNEYYRFSHSNNEIKDLVVDIIDYHTVLDRIFDQLGGMSFEERAIKEVKDRLKNKCYNEYHDEWNIKIKGNKFTYTGGYCNATWGSDYHFCSVEWLNSMLDAIAYNIYGKKSHIYALDRLYECCYVTLTEDDFKNGFSAPSVGVEHIKFFKNGRVDITFQSGEFCRNFAREWCGYTLV